MPTRTRFCTARGCRRCSSRRSWRSDRLPGCTRSTRTTLEEWIARLRDEAGDRVPVEGHCVPARDGGARAFRQALPRVRHNSTPHRIRRQRVQLLSDVPDSGRLLADRALSRLLKQDWPRNLDEWEEHFQVRQVRDDGPTVQ